MKPLVVKRKITSRTYDEFCLPLRDIPSGVPMLKSRGDRPLQMTFENQLNAVIWFHLQGHDSARHLVFDLNENNFAKEFIAPDGGISRSSFSEAINNRGLEQLQRLLQNFGWIAHALDHTARRCPFQSNVCVTCGAGWRGPGPRNRLSRLSRVYAGGIDDTFLPLPGP